MRPRLTRKQGVVIGLVALAVVGGGVGGAVAASGGSDPAGERQAFLDDAAKRLGVTSAKLESALQEAAKARVDAAVAAGRLTKEQGDRLKSAIDSGRLGAAFVGPGRFGGFGHLGPLRGVFEAAATYLGLTQQALSDQLRSGKSLAGIAQAQGKSVDGLKSAIVAAVKTRLDQAVQDKKLTSDQAAKILDGLQSRLDDLVNRSFPSGQHSPEGSDGFHEFPGHGFDGDRGSRGFHLFRPNA